VDGLAAIVDRHLEPTDPADLVLGMELVLEGLHQNSMLSRERTDQGGVGYKDMLNQMLSGLGED
jgi:magnesium chelatase subunit I